MLEQAPNNAAKDDKVSVWERRAFEKQLLNIIPELRAFARFLAGDPAEADDLVQDTVVRALRSYKLFDLSTNMRSWTFTILRNVRINNYRKRRFEELEEVAMMKAPTRANQEDSLELKQALKALEKLPAPQREVIALVRGAGVTYEEAAAIMNCKVGTVKNRVNRADAALRALLGPDFRGPRRARAEHDTADQSELSA